MEDTRPSPTLETLLSLWPVVSSLSHCLPVGDLITLSRVSVSLRAVLHGYEKAGCLDCNVAADKDRPVVREGLNIGNHGTPYWQQLKSQAPFECSSRTHTKGPTPKPCRYCSKPICDACIVRSSLARGHENTFQNRTRYLCKTCWQTGNASQSERFRLVVQVPAPSHADAPLKKKKKKKQQRMWYDADGRTKDPCTCTLKDNGWLCLDCKDLQNWEVMAGSAATTYCHGKDCREPLDADDKERRRICLWCDKALPRQIGGTTRYHWTQTLVEARARNVASRQADLDEYNRRRRKLMRMSRREMRGDEAVRDDPDADLPQFVRHLDTLNYRSYMKESAAPSGDSVYDSKRGYWRYSRDFLLAMRRRCARVPPPSQICTDFTAENQRALTFARTNAQLLTDLVSLTGLMPSVPEDRVKEWCALKAVILEVLLVQKLGYKAAQQTIQEEYDFYAPVREYRHILRLWFPRTLNKSDPQTLDNPFGPSRNDNNSNNNDDKDPPQEFKHPPIPKGTVAPTTEARPTPSPNLSNKTSEAEDGDILPLLLQQQLCGHGHVGIDITTPRSSNYDTHDLDLQRLRQNGEVDVPVVAQELEPASSPSESMNRTSSQRDTRLLTEDLDLAETTAFQSAASDSQAQVQIILDLENEHGGLDEEEEEDEDPPPYTAEGWIWP